MQYKAVIFDLDGTLLDTLDDLADAGNRVLVAAGLPAHPVAGYRMFVGDGLQSLIERIVPADRRERKQLDDLAAAFREDYGRNWSVRTSLYEGVAAMLTALQVEGLALTVLSNKPHDFTQLCVSKFLGEWNFREVVGQQPGRARKPDPAGAMHIAGLLGLPPVEILYVGDTATDMKTAAAAGMKAVGVLWGFRTAGELLASGATYLAGQPLDVLKVITAH